MKKHILLILIFATAALATAAPSGAYMFYVENTTMVDAYFNIFNAISALFKNNDYLDLLRLAFLIGGFFVFAGSVLSSWEGSGNSLILAPYGKYLIVGMALLTVVFSQKTTMVVQTENIPSFCATSSPTTGTAVELPSILAYVFKTTNEVGRGLTQLAESSFSLPHTGQGNASMSSSDGYLGSLKQTIKVLTINPNRVTNNNKPNMTNPDKFDFNQEWTNFFTKCVYHVANNKPNGNDIITEMVGNKDLYKWSKEHLDYAYPATTKKVGEYLIDFQSGNISCRDYFTKLELSTQAMLDNFACTLPIANGGVLELLTGINGAANPALELSRIGRQAGIVNSLRNVAANNAVGIQGGQSFTGGKVRADSNVNNLSSASYMAEMLPFVQMTMRAILYAFFPFVFVVVLLPGGIQVLTQYLQTMIWVELWAPTAAVINMFMNLQVKATVGEEYTTNGLTLISSIDMLSEANTIAGAGAMLYLSIPALTWLILKGSGQMLGKVMGGVATDFSSGLESDKKGNELGKEEQRRIINAERALKNEKALSHGEMVHFENMANGASSAGTMLSQIENGINKEQDAAQQKKSGELGIAAVQKSLTGSNENVGQIKAGTAGRSLVKEAGINDGTTYNDYANLAKSEVANTKGTSKVVETEGTKGLENSKIQSLTTESRTANAKKDYMGSNAGVADVMTDKNLAALKTDKKTFDKYSTDKVSDSNFEKVKEDITKTLTTKAGIESGGQDTEEVYSSEAKQSLEDRRANIDKADLNGDGKISASEAKEYGGDVSNRAIADQHALKAKNARLLENAPQYANSQNKDVKDTFNKAYEAARGQGKDAAAIAGALAVQTSIATKEQVMNTDEKSEFVDRMGDANLTGVDKGKVGALDDIGKISNTNSSIENYLDVSQEQNSSKVYNGVAKNFRKQGMNEMDSRKETIKSFAKDGKTNGAYTKSFIHDNIKDTIKNRDEKIGQAAYDGGFTKDNTSALKTRQGELKSTIDAFDKFKNDRGQLPIGQQMQIQPLILERDKNNLTLEQNSAGIKAFRKTEAGQNISTESAQEMDSLITELQESNAINVDENGNIDYLTSNQNVTKENMTMQDKINLTKEREYNRGKEQSVIGNDGRKIEVVTDMSGTRVTDFSGAKSGYSNDGYANNDVLYTGMQTKIIRDNREDISTTISGVKATANTLKELAGVVGLGKVMKMK